MSIRRILLIFSIAVFSDGSVHAQTVGAPASDSQPKPPLGQATESVGKNLARDPDNKGLQNAAQRIKTNQARIEEKRDASEGRREAREENRSARDTDVRPNIERPVRPERPARPTMPDRPGRG